MFLLYSILIIEIYGLSLKKVILDEMLLNKRRKNMSKKRKIVSLVMTFCMVLMLFPVMTKSVKAAEKVKRTTNLSFYMNQHMSISYMSTDGTVKTAYTIDGDITDSAEGWQWYLDGNSELGYGPRTIVLDGLNIETSANGTGCISLPTDETNIVIKGSNTITNTSGATGYTFGIYGSRDINISGTGSLEIILSSECGLQCSGIISEGGNVSIKDATIEISQTDASANVPSDGYYGIKAANITIEDATINASINGAGNTYGLKAQNMLKLSGTSSLRIDGSTAALSVGTVDLSDGYQVLGKDGNSDYTIQGDFDSGLLVEASDLAVSIKDVKIDKTYKVKYDGNGKNSGTVPAEETTLVISSNITVKDNTGEFKRDGYTFEGWNTVADGSGTSYAAGDTFKLLSDTTLYAQWKEVPKETDIITDDENGNVNGGTKENTTTPSKGEIPNTGDASMLLLWLLTSIIVGGVYISLKKKALNIKKDA